jgi:hypothetical protein
MSGYGRLVPIPSARGSTRTEIDQLQVVPLGGSTGLEGGFSVVHPGTYSMSVISFVRQNYAWILSASAKMLAN